MNTTRDPRDRFVVLLQERAATLEQRAKKFQEAATFMSQTDPEVLALLAKHYRKELPHTKAPATADINNGRGLTGRIRSVLAALHGEITIHTVYDILKHSYQFTSNRKPKAQISEALRNLVETGDLEVDQKAKGKGGIIVYRKTGSA